MDFPGPVQDKLNQAIDAMRVGDDERAGKLAGEAVERAQSEGKGNLAPAIWKALADSAKMQSIPRPPGDEFVARANETPASDRSATDRPAGDKPASDEPVKNEQPTTRSYGKYGGSSSSSKKTETKQTWWQKFLGIGGGSGGGGKHSSGSVSRSSSRRGGKY